MLKHRTLTDLDKKRLRYQTRPALVTSILFAIVISGVSLTLFIISKENVTEEDKLFNIISISSSIIISFFIAYFSSKKYLKDVRNGEKEIVLKPIQKKEHKIDYEAGSGKISHVSAREMNAFDSYSIIIDNTRYRVDKEFYNDCNEGDEVEFHYALKSKFMLSMELAKNHRLNKLS